MPVKLLTAVDVPLHPGEESTLSTAHIEIVTGRECRGSKLPYSDGGLFIQSENEDISTIGIAHTAILGWR